MRFLATFLAVSLVLSCGVLAANVVVDPHGIFGSGRFPVLVATSRSEKLARLERTEPPPQALILGSSIMMRFDPAVLERLTGLTAFNLSVDSGKPEDFVALLEYIVRELGMAPRLVVLGVSPRTFTSLDNEGFDERLLGSHRLLRHVPMHPAARVWRRAATYLETLDWTYAIDVGRSVRRSRVDSAAASRYTFEANGFLRTEEPYNQPGWYAPWVARATEPRGAGLSRERQRYFETLRRRCRELALELVVLITPEAPEIIAFENDRHAGRYDRQHQALAAYLRDQVAADPFTLHDFSRIERFGGVDEFMGSHPSIENSTRMLERMFASRALQ